MITHCVLLQPKVDLTKVDRRAFVTAFERAVREIPSIRGVRVGVRVKHGAGYEQGMPDAAEFLAVLDFDDLDGLKAYLTHPAHAELGMLFGKSLSSALVYDFEMGDVQMLEHLI
jgi:Stress responsive A/B Barrel Domain